MRKPYSGCWGRSPYKSKHPPRCQASKFYRQLQQPLEETTLQQEIPTPLLTEPLPVEIEAEKTPAQSIDENPEAGIASQKANPSWKVNLLLMLILLVGAYFRFVGLNWDQNFHQHPDERFITMAADGIRGVSGISAYFDTATSTLNPLNYGSYTYGMLPLFITRMVAEWLQMANYDRLTLVGRGLSGVFDLAAVWLLYLLGKRLYNKRTGILAAALGAAAVLPIQLSHFFAVDSFSTVFVIASVYFAVLAIPLDQAIKITRKNLLYFGLVGLVVGLAGACKINTLPVLGVIFLAGLARLILDRKEAHFRERLLLMTAGWALAVTGAVIAFRIFQPYAFAGPGILWGGAQPTLAGCDQRSDQPGGRPIGLASQYALDRPPDHVCLEQYGGVGIGNSAGPGGLVGVGLGGLAHVERRMAGASFTIRVGGGLLYLAKCAILALYALFLTHLSIHHPVRSLGGVGAIRPDARKPGETVRQWI